VSDEEPMRAPSVGIIYLVGDRLWIDSTPLARGMNFGDYVIHECDHQRYWKKLLNQMAVPDTDYEEYARGRVTHNRKSGKFILLADRCILHEKKLVNAILSRMHLPAGYTETGTDGLYRCFRCMRHSR
jgi:hypothetical protein